MKETSDFIISRSVPSLVWIYSEKKIILWMPENYIPLDYSFPSKYKKN